MNDLRLLLLSNSTMAGEPWMGWPEPHLKAFLKGVTKPLFFVPFAGVRMSWDTYAGTARERFGQMGFSLVAAHETKAPLKALEGAGAVVIGGGNTFHLLHHLYASGLLGPIRERVRGGLPFVGWSAGSNVACPSIRTTNDMPVIEPPSLDALGLVPFQINPHFTEVNPPGLAGETRVERLLEFIEVNPGMTVVGLPEGDLVRVEGRQAMLDGSFNAKLFLKGREPWDVKPGEKIPED